MIVVMDDLWFCEDCLFAAVNGDFSAIDNDERVEEIVKGLEQFGPHLVPDCDGESGDGVKEFSYRICDCCRTSLGGSRYKFAVLGEGG